MQDQGTTAIEAIQPFRNLTEEALSGIRQIYASLPGSRETLDVLFAIDAAQTDPTEAWVGFFVEAASGNLIWDERPTGTLTTADARWVLDRFDHAPTLAGMALLVRLSDEATKLPPEFPAEVRRRAALFTTFEGALATRTKKTAVPYLRLVA